MLRSDRCHVVLAHADQYARPFLSTPSPCLECVDLGEHNVHLWSDQAWTMAEETDENTEETHENSDHKVGMLAGEANGVRDLGSHQDRISTNGTIMDIHRLENIPLPPRMTILPNGSIHTSNFPTLDLCVHRLLEFIE